MHEGLHHHLIRVHDLVQQALELGKLPHICKYELHIRNVGHAKAHG